MFDEAILIEMAPSVAAMCEADGPGYRVAPFLDLSPLRGARVKNR